jgi:uncharacterized protein YwqG
MIDDVRQRLVSAGLEHRADDILKLFRPAVRLITVGGNTFPLGCSRIGGVPDVQSAWEWPSWKDQPLAFLAQINLHDMRNFDFCNILPREGLLQFFYDAQQRTWGFDPKDVGSWFVNYEPSITSLQPSASGVPAYPSSRLQAIETVTLPQWESPEIEGLILTAAEREKYLAVLDQLEEQYLSDGPNHQLLGNPLTIQGEMQTECQLVSNGLYCGDASGYRDPKAASLMHGSNQWRLLFQLGSDDTTGMMWGDLGYLYFWIREDALRSRDFHKTWMILQCS